MKKLLIAFLFPLALFGAAGDIKIGYKAPNNISWIDAIFATQNSVLLGLNSSGVPYVATSGTLNLNALALPAGLSGTMLQLGQADATNTRLTMDGFGASPVIDLRRANGTNASRTAILSGNFLGSISGAGYGASAYSSGRGSINFVANENWSNSAQGTNIELRTNSAGATSSTKTYTFASTGLTFEVAAMRITGDFSNATVASRLMIQTSSTDSVSAVSVIPNGTGTAASVSAVNNSTPTNAGFTSVGTTSTQSLLIAGHFGSGSTLPLSLRIDSTDYVTVKTTGIVNIVNTPNYANNAAALSGGLVAGDVYRNGDTLQIVH